MSPRRSPAPPHLVVIGGANTDFLVRAARLPQPGETITGEEFDHAAAGGKGANQAVAAARLGARVTFIGRVGADDRGRALLRRLSAEGIHVRHVARDRHVPTGVALISVDAHGEKQIVVAPGANARLTAADIQRAAPVITRAGMVILQFEIPMRANLAAARLAHRAGVPVVLDPAPAVKKLPKELLRYITVLRANEYEAEALTGIVVKNRALAKKAALRLLELGPRAAIIAAGQGNLAVWREGAVAIHALWLPRLPVKAIDATGAGDAFAAALAVALAEGQPIPHAARFANAAAALATTQLGAQQALPKRIAVLALLRRARRSPVV
ncbi:MAG: ribokinase [Chthoniobacter sp.]|uniref:ribokinase n=1 Tax=Chthoniobacter sp. TaxID=2510640 RepID=UPI0032A60538